MARQIAFMTIALVLAATMMMGTAVADDEGRHHHQEGHHVRQRMLPGGDYDLNLDEMQMEELALFVLAALLILFMICCCCCRHWSLWDCVALACLWEICCDNPEQGDGLYLC